MELNELVSEKSSFFLNGKEYFLNAWKLSDTIWFRQNYGNSVKNVLSAENIDPEAMLRIAFRLLNDKTDFAPKKIVDYNENGEAETRMTGGWKLLALELNATDGFSGLISAVFKAIANGNPKVVEKTEEVETEKK